MEQKTKPKYHLTRIKLGNLDHILNSFQRRVGKGTEAMQRTRNQQCMPSGKLKGKFSPWLYRKNGVFPDKVTSRKKKNLENYNLDKITKGMIQ